MNSSHALPSSLARYNDRYGLKLFAAHTAIHYILYVPTVLYVCIYIRLQNVRTLLEYKFARVESS